MVQQGMQLSQEQRLQMVLAPQLRQSLELLQVPMLELRAMVRAELEKNPTLEEPPENYTPLEEDSGAEVEHKDADQKALDFRKEFEVLARLDDEWRDYFFQEENNHPYSAEAAERRQYFFDSVPQRESLQVHLINQLGLSDLDAPSRQIGELIIGSINDDGYLTTPINELADSINVDPEQFKAVLETIQDFDPTGVGSSDLKTCLLCQLRRLDKSDSLSAAIVRDHLELLGGRKIQDLARILKTTPEEVQKAADFIATLNPRPGSAYTGDASAYIAPDVQVRKLDGVFVVILNDEQIPHIRISRQYRTLMNDAQTTTELRDYVQDKVRAGTFLIKSIQQRQQTIFNIATEIVKVQEEFLEHGVSHLKPLTMAQVAKAVGLHETTISRAVSGKHMRTPVGLFEMKYFFTPAIRTMAGGSVSNKSVMDMISGMVSAESAAAPLSDQDIMDRLKTAGIDVARRTVAKYRMALHIPPSHLRKTFG
jgi:RNA polymerase sigma-54 factor